MAHSVDFDQSDLGLYYFIVCLCQFAAPPHTPNHPPTHNEQTETDFYEINFFFKLTFLNMTLIRLINKRNFSSLKHNTRSTC